jgi:hypothetical protein
VTRKYFNIRKPMQIKAEAQVLDEPVRPVAETDLTAPTGLAGPETGLTAEGGVSSSSAEISTQMVGAEVQDWRTPIIAYLKDFYPIATGLVQREIFGVWHLNIFWLTMSFIVEPPMILFSSVWLPIRLVLLWEKCMKASVVHINRLLK